ncbi:MAG: extensin, partial [Sphingomonas bacterium]|nr:extensin [Sphingomonas bacterium]
MRALRRVIGWIVVLALVAGTALIVFTMVRGRPQDLPWTSLDLGQPIGLFTGLKLAALTDDFPTCEAV